MCYCSAMTPKWHWNNAEVLKQPRKFICGYCSAGVGTDRGYNASVQGVSFSGAIGICPTCTEPTYFNGEKQVPNALLGSGVSGISDANTQELFNEARICISSGAYTASVMICRKILMHLAVDQGADPNGNFLGYVTYLSEKGFVPPNGKGWVDLIRSKGNEANHEIVVMTLSDAEKILKFTEMLLRFIYEFPAMIK